MPVTFEVLRTAEVVDTILQKDANGLLVFLLNQVGIDMATMNVRVTADQTHHIPKGIRAFPGRGKRADCAAAGTTNGSAFWVLRELVLLPHFGKYFIDDEPSVSVVENVVLTIPVVGVSGPDAVRELRTSLPGRDKDPDRDRNLFFRD